MALRTFFKSEGTEKEEEEKNSSSTQAKGGRREKSSLTTGVSRSEGGELYL